MSGYRVPARVAYVVADGPDVPDDSPTVFLMHLPDGPPVVVRGSAAMIWVLAADGEEDVATAVADLVGLGREDVAGDVTPYLDDLVGRGLLEVDAPLVDGGSP